MRPPTLREREVLEETEFTRPVDFQSFRRAFKQALADAGVELQQAMALSGATDVKAHARHQRINPRSYAARRPPMMCQKAR